MLDPDHTLTPHIIAASRSRDEILKWARRMTLATPEKKRQYRDDCGHALNELRQIAREPFANREQILPAIDDLEAALDQLSRLPQNKDSTADTGHCPVCGTAIEPRRFFGLLRAKYNRYAYCPKCLSLIRAPLAILDSFEIGFATEDI